MTHNQRRDISNAFRLQAIYETYTHKTGLPIGENWKYKAECLYLEDDFFRHKVDLKVDTLMETIDSVRVIT